MKTFGTYYIAVIGDPLRKEWTNVGVIVFDEEGNQYEEYMDTVDRAVQRGDLTSKCGWVERLASFAQNFPNVESVKKSMESTGHAMSRLRIMEGGTTVIREDVVSELFEALVAY